MTSFNFPPISTVPFVDKLATIEDVHAKMIEYQKGVCFIVDAQMSLLAVFTDGDFRRAFFDSNNLSSVIFTLNALDTATLTPIAFDLSDGHSVEYLISLFSKYDIYDIPITNNGKLISSVNIHNFKLSIHD